MVSLRLVFSWIVLLCLCSPSFGANAAPGKAPPLELALAGPMSGPQKWQGEAMKQGASLYVDQVNKTGGIAGRKVELLVFDDAADAKTAETRAREIVGNTNALAVLGHFSDATTLSAGREYQEAGIPYLTGSAMGNEVTDSGDWSFRVMPDARTQGSFIANYARNILGVKNTVIIRDDTDFSKDLVESFTGEGEFLEIEILNSWIAASAPDALRPQTDEIVAVVSTMFSLDFVFLAVQDNDTAEHLIQALRDNDVTVPILASGNLGTEDFANRFARYSGERNQPGLYTGNIFFPAGALLNLANKKAEEFKNSFVEQYGQAPNQWHAAYYDAAAMAIRAIQTSGAAALELAAARRSVRDALAAVDSIDKAFDGVTGYIFFDGNGNAKASISFGTFQDRKLTSAPFQLTPVTNQDVIVNIDEEIAKGMIIGMGLAGSDYYKLTQVVYTGISFNEISQIDYSGKTFAADFNLWFRYKGQLQAHDIIFTNAVDDVNPGKPVLEAVKDNTSYSMYRVKGKFKFFINSRDYVANRQQLGISFQNKTLDTKGILYVVDEIGAGSTDQTQENTSNLAEAIIRDADHWLINDIQLSNRIVEKATFGNPWYLGMGNGTQNFSTFTATVNLEKDKISLRRNIPNRIGMILFFGSLICSVAIAVFFFMNKKRNRLKRRTFPLRVVLSAMLLLGGESYALALLEHIAQPLQLVACIRLFDILWWLVSAYYISRFLEYFLFAPLEDSTSRKIPGLMRGFTNSMIYLLAVFGIIAFVFDQKLTSLLATSGVFAMIIGFAVQANLANIVSGIVLNLERTFGMGDWIKIGTLDEGKVIDMTWRSTKIRNRLGNIVSIPNNKASEAEVQNYSGDDSSIVVLSLELGAQYDPQVVHATIQKALDSCPEGTFVSDPAPVIRFDGIKNSGLVDVANYVLFFWIADYKDKYPSSNTAWQKVWKELHEAGIEAPMKSLGSRLHMAG